LNPFCEMLEIGRKELVHLKNLFVTVVMREKKWGLLEASVDGIVIEIWTWIEYFLNQPTNFFKVSLAA